MASSQMISEAHCPACGRILPEDSRARVCPVCELDGALQSVADGEVDDNVTTPPAWRLGDYVLEEEIARGGMGVVYRARQVSLNRTVAVKMILAGQFAGPHFLQRFQTEAAAAARLQHSNIVAIHEIGESEGRHFFSMDYVDGPDLQEAVRRGPFPPARAAACGQRVAEAIHYAHQQGVLHRDLKPSNILLGNGDQPMITDFGLAKVVTCDTELTLSGQVLGTPNYLPPEQASGKRGEVGPWSDVYGLGAVLYFLLTGRPPFQAQELSEVLEQVLHREPVSPRWLNPSVPRDLETICLKCLQKDPPRRYATAREVAEDLGRHLRQETIVARPVAAPEKAWRWCRRQPALAAAIGACAVALLGGIAGVTWQWQRAEAERRVAQRSLYESDMLLAQQAYQDKHFGRVEQLLEKHRPAPAATADEDLRGWEWRYLWGQIRSDERFTLGSHSNTVWFLAFSPDGRTLASSSNYGLDNDVQLWDVPGRRWLTSLRLSHFTRGMNIAFSPDCQTLAVANGPQVRFHHAPDWADGQDALEFPAEVVAVAYSPDGRQLAVADRHDPGRLHCFDLQGGRREIRGGPSGPWNFIAFSPDGRYVALNQTSRPRVVLWDRSADAVVAEFPGPGGWTRYAHLAFSPDGRVLSVVVANYEADRVDFWSIPEGTKIRSEEGTDSTYTSVAFSADSRFAYLAGTDQTVAVMEVATGERLGALRGHRDEVWCLAASPDGTSLATGSRDETIRLWPAPNRPWAVDQLPLPTSTRQLYLSGDGTALVTISTNDQVRLWNTRQLSQFAEHPLPLTTIRRYSDNKYVQVALDAAAGRLVIGDVGGVVKVWRTEDWHEERELVGFTNRVCGLTLSDDGTTLAASDTMAPWTTVLWDVASGAEKARIPELPRNAGLLAFSPRQSYLALRLNEADAWGPDVALWCLSTRRIERVLSKRRHRVTDLAFSPDERLLATAGEDASIAIWEVSTGRRVRDLTGPLSRFMAVAWSPDGRRLAGGGIDGSISLWNTESYQTVGRFKAHPDRVLDVAFLEDGDTLVSVSLKSLKVWRAPSFEEVDAGGWRRGLPSGRQLVDIAPP